MLGHSWPSVPTAMPELETFRFAEDLVTPMPAKALAPASRTMRCRGSMPMHSMFEISKSLLSKYSAASTTHMCLQ